MKKDYQGIFMYVKKFISLLLALLFTLTPLAACASNASLPPNDYSGSNEIELPSDDTESGADDNTSSGDTESGNAGNGTSGEMPDEPTPTPTPTPEPEPTPPVVQTTKYIRCTADSVNVRSGAGTSYSILGSAEKGTSYALIEKSGNWYKTYYKNKVAYLYAEYAAVFTLEKSDDAAVEKVINEGYKLIGVPYVYGAVRLHDGKGKLLKGFTKTKFDCSSLVQYVFYQGASVLLNTTTRTQVKQGKYVSRANLQRGDCLFFTNEERQYNTGVERIGHVAIYLGDGYILHTASDYARIEKMSNKRWKFYVEARRFL